MMRVLGHILQEPDTAAAIVKIHIVVEDDLRGVVHIMRWKAVYN